MHPEVLQGTAEFHHEITHALLPEVDPVFDNATALDTPVRSSIRSRRQCRAWLARCCSRVSSWPRGFLVGMRMATWGSVEEEDRKQSIDEQDIFYGVVFFLAALTRGLFSRVLGADDPLFRPVRGTRGETGAAAGPGTTGADSSSSDVITVAASASETPSRWARAVRERAGASPRVRSAASSTGKRT